MDEPRVPMPSQGSVLDPGDLSVSRGPDMRVGRRYHLDVDEAALARIGSVGLEHAVARLGEEVAYRHRAEVERTVSDLLRDREWVEPIIARAIRDAVREKVRDMFLQPPEGREHGE